MAEDVSVRISAATPEADLAAVVWPGISAIYCPRAESAEAMQNVAEQIGRLEQLRGIRPGTIGVRPLIDSARGVSLAHDIASSTPRIHAFGVGPNLRLSLGVEPDADVLAYARAECELHARALGVEPHDLQVLLD